MLPLVTSGENLLTISVPALLQTAVRAFAHSPDSPIPSLHCAFRRRKETFARMHQAGLAQLLRNTGRRREEPSYGSTDALVVAVVIGECGRGIDFEAVPGAIGS